MKRILAVGAAVASLAVMAFLVGCEREGPMERAGKEVDRGVDKAGEAIEKAGDKVKDATKN